MSTEALLEIRGVESRYGSIVALRGVDLEVAEGDIVALIGANGAGKSTLMTTIFGTPRASRGRILFAGRDMTNLPTHEIARCGLALSPEGRRIFPRMTVHENLQMGAAIDGHARFDDDLERVYAIFPRLKERSGQNGGTLSGGEQQMLAIGRALMSRPRLLLLDEPSMGLAPLMVQKVFEVIQEVAAEGVTILLVEQNARLALSVAARGYVMESGAITLTDSADALLDNPRVQEAYLGGE